MGCLGRLTYYYYSAIIQNERLLHRRDLNAQYYSGRIADVEKSYSDSTQALDNNNSARTECRPSGNGIQNDSCYSARDIIHVTKSFDKISSRVHLTVLDSNLTL